ncbi:MAG: IS4 family transposase [Flavobacteriaceae bacterium]|nr:IS4 family transposase [Flavobacteriaceae bacterium]
MYLMENTSLGSKNTTLISVLEQHFNGELNLARVKLICLFITTLCKVKTVNYDRLASGFDSKASKNSSYRRIQRFMAEFDFPMKIVSTLIFNLLPKKENLTLVLDRTNWKFGTKNINILMLGVSYKNVAIPLMFSMLDKRGNSNIQERIDLMQKYLEWFGVHTIDCLLADREFVGNLWLEYLNENKIRYHIRIRNNFKVFIYQKKAEIPAFWLFNNLKINEFHHYPKIVELHGQRCYLSGCKTMTRDGKLEFLILVSFNKPEQAMAYYKERWQVETLFKALKSSGFNIEQTHVADLERLQRLFSLTMIAFVWCYKIGDFLDENIKKINIKTHGRRAVSVF